MASGSPGRRPPAPPAQAFVACRAIWHNARTGAFIPAGPASHIPVARFPVGIRLSVYAHVTGGRGSYPLDSVLRDPGGGAAWHWRPGQPLDAGDPLMPQRLAFHDLPVAVP